MWDSCHLWYSFIFPKYVETILEIFLFFYCVLLQHYVTLRLHQISGMIFSFYFNAHRNPQPGFHFWISFVFQRRIHSDFWWSYSSTAAFSDTWHWHSYSFTGQMIRYFWIWHYSSQISANRNRLTVFLNLFFHCLFILKMLECIQKVSISHLPREETYGNKQHDNFKWGT